MRNLLKIIIVVFGALLFTKTTYATEINVPSKANIAIEMETGKILTSKNADEKLAIASVSKIVTMYMTLNKINNEGASWDEVVPIHPYLIELSHEWALGSTPLDGSHEYTVRDLFNAMCIESSNSATMALGDWVAPDHNQSTYIAMVNDFLSNLGLKGFSFVSASGLENSDIPGYLAKGTTSNDYNKLSAKDVSMVARQLIMDFPEILNTSSLVSYTMSDGQVLENTFSVMNGKSQHDKSLNIDGLKTGFTYIAGFCFVGTEFNGEFRTISVVLDSENYGLETNQLMRYARENYTSINVDFNKLIEDPSIEVSGGNESKVKVEPCEDVSLIVNKGTNSIKLNKVLSTLNAPVPKGREHILGDIYDEKDTLGYVNKTPQLLVRTTESIDFKKCELPKDTKIKDFLRIFNPRLLTVETKDPSPLMTESLLDKIQ